MNILSIVFAILLILSFFIHTQMENYKHFAGIKKEYNDFMKNDERQFFNERQTKLYQKLAERSSSQGTGNEKTKPGRGKINFLLIIDQEKSDKNSEASKQQRIALKELMRELFHDASFYRRLEKKRPNFLDELINALVKAASGKKIKVVQDLEKFNLGDPKLQDAYYKMMVGKKKSEIGVDDQTLAMDDVDDEEEADEEDGIDARMIRNQSYLSLKDFIHLDNHPKIRVYLASTEVLRALFIEEVVNDIINTREELGAQVRKETLGKGPASDQFSKFKDKAKPGIKEDILDFQVTKTDAKKFR